MPHFFKQTFILALLFSQCTFFSVAMATEADNIRYVSDFLVINLRNKIEPPYKVVEKARSNDTLIVLQEKGKYLEVKTSSGTTGWISKQYTTTSEPKSVVIKRLENQIKILEKNGSIAGETVEESSAELEDLRLALSKATAKISTLEEELQGYKDMPVTEKNIELETQYKKLQEQYAQLENAKNTAVKPANIKALIELQKENEKLRSKQMIYLFIAGALTLMIGMFLGKSPDKRRPKRLFF